MSKLSKTEQETIFRYDNEDKTATIYSCCQKMIRRLEKLCSEYPEEYIMIKRDQFSITVSTPKKNIRLKKPRSLSAEHKEIISGNLTKYRETVSTK